MNVWCRWILLLLSCFPVLAFAQFDREAIIVDEVMPVVDSTGRMVLPYDLAPLDTLIARAHEYSPLLNSQDAVRDAAILNREIEGRKWMDMTKVFGNASYGTGQYLTNISDGVGQGATLAVRQNLFYNTGITMTVSPWDLITRKRRLEVMDADIYRASFEMHMLEDKVSETVIERYQGLMLAIEVQEIALQGLSNQEINAELAERYFQTGDISFEEYTRALESRNKAEKDVAIAQNDVKRAYLLLKIVVGGELH